MRRLPYVWSNERSSERKKLFIRWRSHWRDAKLVKVASRKLFFLTELKKKTCETLKPVRWSRGGLHWKVILVSCLCICNKCAFFKSPFTFWLTLVLWTSTQNESWIYV
jgi:hypothetical protein